MDKITDNAESDYYISSVDAGKCAAEGFSVVSVTNPEEHKHFHCPRSQYETSL